MTRAKIDDGDEAEESDETKGKKFKIPKGTALAAMVGDRPKSKKWICIYNVNHEKWIVCQMQECEFKKLQKFENFDFSTNLNLICPFLFCK